MPHTISYKVKPFTLHEHDNTTSQAIDFKRVLSRKDCSMKPCDHTYYNSDLFPAMLNRAYRQIIGEYRTWARLSELPEGVSVDTSKFLAVVTIKLPDTFK